MLGYDRFSTGALLAIGLCSSLLAQADTPSGTWRQFDQDDGIILWRLDVPGVEMPGFRGQTTIAAPAESILREIEKVDQHPEWMHRCAEARMIRRIDATHAIVYNRTDTPWPVWDRDVVLDTHVKHASDGKRITLTFEDLASDAVPVPERVVRMPRLEGSYDLEKLSQDRTRVTYTVEVEIGGSIPDWVAERVARDMPFETLSRLRERVQALSQR